MALLLMIMTGYFFIAGSSAKPTVYVATEEATKEG